MIGVDNLAANEVTSFGPFRLSAAGRVLHRGDDPVVLGSRALDILIALVARAGEVVSRRELIEQVWPGLVVEETNLRVHIANLRKALGDGRDGARYITNIPGRGYCFVAPVLRATSAPAPAAHAVETPVSASPAHLPARLARMVGRGETVAALSKLLASHRFVSVVGPGGMGKTTVAVSVGHALLDDFGKAVFFVDLGTLTNGAFVSATVASALGFPPQAEGPLSGLLAFLAGRRLLLILDSCEHVIDAAATLAERLFSRAPELHILTTTREPLRAEGEHVHLLRPLDYPAPGFDLTAEQALVCPAVQLFMGRAIAGGYRFELTDRDAPIVADICRRLDGIALAIELAGSRVGSYGIRGTADLLDNRFRLLWQGRRSALPRHQTLRSMLDWSYNLLSEFEQAILCKLSVFIGPFTLQGALSVAGDAAAEAPKVAEAVASLVNKSLVWTADFGGATYYRLADTTQTYAAAKLAEIGGENEVRRLHALYHAGLFDSSAISVTTLDGRSMAACAPYLGNVRTALDWSFSAAGDPAIGVALAARSAPLFLGFSLLGECERWCERAMAVLQEADRGTKRELELREALAISAMFTRGNGDEVKEAIERGLGLAMALEDWRHQFHLLAGLNIFLTRIGDFRAAQAVSERTGIVARQVGDPAGMVMAEWMLGVSYHLVGDQTAAQRHCELGLELAAAWGHVHVDFFSYDHRVRALGALARALWLRGQPERALEFAHQALDEAASRDHPVTVCISYIYASQVFLWTGDFQRVRGHTERLIARAAKYSLRPYHAVGLALKGERLIVQGEAGAGIQLLRGALATCEAERHHVLTTAFYRALAQGLALSGQVQEAVTAITQAIELAEREGGTFDLPDLLRTRAEVILAGPQPDLAAAEASLLRSLECARQQSALGWELRTAIQLAHLWGQQGRVLDAHEALASAYRQFTEGFETADLKAAAHLLDELDKRMRSCGVVRLS
jgi:predicted ATPase/DNA-binding winged helix-turn-helix (wHTH) protein